MNAPTCRSERGAALVIALVIVTALGLVGASVLDVADEAFRDDRSAQDVRAQTYAAGGALQALVAAMRGDITWGRDGSPCSDLALVLGGTTVTASCAPLPGSGLPITGALGARADRVVDLTAAIASNRAAHARVEFVDGGGSVPGAVVRVRNWAVAP